MPSYIKTAAMAMRGQTNGGIVYLFPQIFMQIIYLLPLMFLWRIITADGVDAGMTLTQLMSYTYVNALLAKLLIVDTFLTDWDFDTRSTALFTRPISVYGQVISRTAGEWLPKLALFSLPMAVIAPLFGIQIIPRTVWVLPSLVLCASLGFALEFITFCITLRLRHVAWLTNMIRSAVVSFFSGTVIPFRILPFGLDRWMHWQPFGSLGGAVLSLHVGTATPAQIIPAQLVWNAVFWLVAVLWFQKSKERMVSFGG